MVRCLSEQLVPNSNQESRQRKVRTPQPTYRISGDKEGEAWIMFLCYIPFASRSRGRSYQPCQLTKQSICFNIVQQTAGQRRMVNGITHPSIWLKSPSDTKLSSFLPTHLLFSTLLSRVTYYNWDVKKQTYISELNIRNLLAYGH